MSSSDAARGSLYIEAILPLALKGTLTYAVPESLRGKVRPGTLVRVPLGEGKTYVAVVASVHNDRPAFVCKDIVETIGEKPVVTGGQLRLWRWMSEYYMSPLGDIYKTALPAEMRAQRRGRRKPSVAQPVETGEPNALSGAQEAALKGIREAFGRKDVVLLEGVTSSGKTEIYIHLMREAVRNGRQVLYLLPEIALTVQIRRRLGRVFGDSLCVYHSKDSGSERAEIWGRQLSGEPYAVVLGARSAVFLPFTRLGLVIIDEEHDTSFKQQEPAPRYHARSVAIMLARMSGAKTLLGTATPSAESYFNAKSGKYGLVRLLTRHGDMLMPQVDVIDIRDLGRRKMMKGPFSPQLIESVKRALSEGRQAILFKNRRGFAPMVECRDCGWVPRCGCCDVTLTYHKRTGKLTCHYCGNAYQMPAACPACGSARLTTRGAGTEKIEEEVAALFPEARIARMDTDTTLSRSAHEDIIRTFAAGGTDILIGTQMITKGLDFDRVSVVGILDADALLNIPDFRAFEQAYTLMSQVAGRAGRKGRRGLVLLQTRDPELPVVNHVVTYNSEAFYSELLEERKSFNYPPYCRLIYVYMRHRKDETAGMAAAAMGEMLRRWLGERVLGPDKPAVQRVKGMSIRKIMLKLEPGVDLPRVKLYLREARERLSGMDTFSNVQVYFDVDPL